MDLLTLAVVVIAATSVVTLVILAVAALQLKKTLATAEGFIKKVEERVNPIIEYEVKPIAESVRKTLEHVEGIARTAKEGADKVGDTVDAVKEVGATVRTINHILDSEVKGSIINLASLIVGVKTGFITLLGAHRREKEKEA
jgi:uncharacterized protein YoxC